MKVLSARWWFGSRETGRITIAQFPNWPLFAILAGWVIRTIADESSDLYRYTGGAITLLWLYWGGDELVRGVNPWRRVLGGLVIAWQLARLAS